MYTYVASHGQQLPTTPLTHILDYIQMSTSTCHVEARPSLLLISSCKLHMLCVYDTEIIMHQNSLCLLALAASHHHVHARTWPHPSVHICKQHGGKTILSVHWHNKKDLVKIDLPWKPAVTFSSQRKSLYAMLILHTHTISQHQQSLPTSFTNVLNNI